MRNLKYAMVILFLLISLLLGQIAPTKAAEPDLGPQLLAYQHENLTSHKVENLQKLKGKPTLMMFFEPQCSWCFKQGKAFNRLLQQCPTAVNIVALGSHGDKVTLRRELWRMKLNFPGYLVGKTMMGELGALPATPMTLITDENGNLSGYLRGYIKLEQLLPLLRTKFGLQC
ncbi:thioredoxin family protein [Shewanella sp. D64]|uniref:TlpA family protein disulfide reductase n=1 Tax=unclassified Shewanella TaxID=196818 RepID=UPI0022BA6C4B|nr:MULTISPECIES: hypothetical protein [unclassified Shewanella]MEC4726130.1 thioredoxin family protein [Shewanella sp. D64]MEC4737954.1 thioredoxin family protein [Shewanella sp. E94]WBJ96154.1 thioredoxin family protein [Shewanella sp. MTB7]